MMLFLFGVSITLNIVLIITLAIFLRIRYIDCGNIFNFFKDDAVVDRMAAKDFLE